MAQCKDCRFYEGRRCTERNFGAEPFSSSCSYFSAFSTRDSSGFTQCKDCRFYSGGKCIERNCSAYAMSSKCSFGSVCK